MQEKNLKEVEKNIFKLDKEFEDNEGIVRQEAKRAVLIICENQLSVKEVIAKLKQNGINQRKIFKYDSSLQKFELPFNTVNAGDIIVATNIAGRGTDLETTRLLEQNGGLHVILSYMPSNVRVEAQGFGRTARKGHEGTGRYIVYDYRAAELPISMGLLMDERDERETRRLKEIIRITLPRIKLEEELFQKYAQLQDEIRNKLRSLMYDADFIALQIKSLQDRWGFWLDKYSKDIDNVYLDGKVKILQLYNLFDQKARSDLERNEFRLIESQGELLRLAKYYIKKDDNKENYAFAERCYDRVIAIDPEFASFAYYYKALCVFGQSSTFENKKEARTNLKKAVRLFEDQLSRLSTFLQIVKVLGDAKLKEGQGTEVDFFSEHITNDMTFINIHMGAAIEALGQPLSAKSFKGNIVGTDSDKVFENIKKQGFIKGTRVSNKLEFKWEILISKNIKSNEVLGISNELMAKINSNEEHSIIIDSILNGDRGILANHGIKVRKAIIRDGNLIKIPSQFASYHDKIVDFLEAAFKARKNGEEKFDVKGLEEFVITREDFEHYIKRHVEVSKIFVLNKDAEKNVKGSSFWYAIDKDEGLKLKTTILSINDFKTEQGMVDLIKGIFAIEISENRIQEIKKKLITEKIIVEENGYAFKGNVRTKFEAITQTIVLKANINEEEIHRLESLLNRIFNG
ncbi:MAG: hypothetical protein WCP46_08500, partial [Alphaproteobacteria bacterium]